MYRVYDNQERKWVTEDILLAPNNDLCRIQPKKFFKKTYKVDLLHDERYIYQIDIGLYDKKQKLIFEGDIAKTNDGDIGLISYAPENASYVFLNYDEGKYFPLGTNICVNYLEVIGNIFDTPEMLQKGDNE